MKLENLKSEELILISGGNEEDYNLGHAIGSHVRSGLETVGQAIKWFSEVVNNLVPF
jgi:hypothetical protein